MSTTDAGEGLDKAAWEASIRELLREQPLVGLALGAVSRDGLELFHGHGVADRETGEPITQDTVFRIASITKTFTAIAVMQLHEQGLVELDAPANEYLGAFPLIPADPEHRPATVRDLVTHTAGLGELAHARGMLRPDFGESFPADEPLPSLADFYQGGLRLRAEPGERFVYNNHGPATLGQLVEDVSGQALGEYLRTNLFEPLGMASSDLGRSELVEPRVASGYEFRFNHPRPIVDRKMVTAGAASIYSTPADMARYAAALLDRGAGRHGSILSAESLETMFAPHYRPDPRIPGMGLGFSRYNIDGQVGVGHQGSHPGFHAQMTLVPERGVGVLAFTNGAAEADLWLPGAVAHLLRSLAGIDLEVESPEVPSRPEMWPDLCGWYPLQASPSDVRLRVFMGFGAEVFVRDGRLMLRFLSPIPDLFRGFPLVPDDPDAFRIDMPEFGGDFIRVFFQRSRGGEPDRMCVDLMPLVFEKRRDRSNPRKLAQGALVVGGAAGLAVYLLRRQL